MFHEDELKRVGSYFVPSIYGMPAGEAPKYNTPITPRENMIRMLERKEPLWLPNQNLDNNIILPDFIPDANARNYGGIDWFGIDWQYEPMSEAAMVRPGTRRLSDLCNWREELQFPDIDALDWKKDYEENYKGKLSPERFTIFVVFNGLFERLADLTSFEDAFCYLLEEPEELTAFFTKLTDWHIHLLEVIKENYPLVDMILFHDDMGSQRAPFFSSSMYDELMVPHYQRITQRCHALGMFIALHSCGCVGPHLPFFIKAGFDAWEGQDNANDKESLMSLHGEGLAQLSQLFVPAELSDEEAVALIHRKVDGLGSKKRYACRLTDGCKNRKVDLAQELYRYSRLAYDSK